MYYINQALLDETSSALYAATEETVFLKNINILLPSSWSLSISGINPTITRT